MPSQRTTNIILVLSVYICLHTTRILWTPVLILIPWMSELHAQFHLKMLWKALAIKCLSKEILIPHLFIRRISIQNNYTWQFSFRIIPISLHIQLATILKLVIHISLSLPSINSWIVTMLTSLHLTVMKCVWINTIGSHHLTRQAQRRSITHRGYQSKRTNLHTSLQCIASAYFKLWALRYHRDYTCSCILSCTLHQIVLTTHA